MENQNRTSYTFTHRLKGEATLGLFEKYYLQINEKGMKRAREFKLELAMLSPKAVHVHERALHWLAAACISGLSTLYLIYFLFSTPNYDDLWLILAAIGATILLTVIFSALVVVSSKRKWVLQTRAALYPLVEIPYLKKDKKQAQQFVQQLQMAIEMNVAEKGYNNEVLFAGEMRMLRRLAKNQILSNDNYNRAKKDILENKGHMEVAS